MCFDHNCIISLERVDMLSFFLYNTDLDFSDLDACFMHSMLHFTFALKDFIEIWISFGLIKYS